MATTDSPTTRSKATAAKPAAKRAGARRARSTATSNATRATPTTRTEQAQQLAERVVLIPVGAALEARDRIAGAIDVLSSPTSSREAIAARLDQYERRGGDARANLEREVRRTRRGFDKQRAEVQKTVTNLPNRVENVVRNGADAGITLVGGVQERISKIA